ncbi:MAG: hypothetical protein QXL15_02300, partial [Candidatus Korarchaeota archaeon]
TDTFQGTNSKFAKKLLKDGMKAWGGIIRGAAGAFSKEVYPGMKVSTELAGYLHVTGIKGYIHSNEDLSKYQLENEFESLKKKFKADATDLVLVIFCKESDLEKTKYFISRISWLSKGVPEETRAANPDGTTSFLRPLPGAARMYPETDIPPISATMVQPINVPLPEEMRKTLLSMELSENMVDQLLFSRYLDIFLQLAKEFSTVSPALIARIILSETGEVKKKFNLDIEPTLDIVRPLLVALRDGKMVREAIPDVMAEMFKSGTTDIDLVLRKLNLYLLSEEEIKSIIRKEFGNLPADKLIGAFMSKYRGRVDITLLKKVIANIEKT